MRVLGGVFARHVAGGEDASAQLLRVLRMIRLVADHPADVFQHSTVCEEDRPAGRKLHHSAHPGSCSSTQMLPVYLLKPSDCLHSERSARNAPTEDLHRLIFTNTTEHINSISGGYSLPPSTARHSSTHMQWTMQAVEELSTPPLRGSRKPA